MAGGIIDKINQVADLPLYFKGHFSEKFMKEGDNHHCPFHADGNASFSIYKEKGKWHWRCFGACDRGGDIIDFERERLGCDNKEAIRSLAGHYGVNMGNGNQGASPSKRQKSGDDSPVPLGAQWAKLLANPIEPSVREYLEDQRKLTGMTEHLTSKGQLAFNPRYFASWVDGKEVYRAHVHACAFPITDYSRKELLGIQFVPMEPKFEKRFAKGSSGKDGFFRVGDSGEWQIVCEANIDALSVYVACRGALDIEVISILSVSGIDKIGKIPGYGHILFFDKDFPGIKATIQAIIRYQTNVRYVDWFKDDLDVPESIKDANDLLKAGLPDTILRLVKGATSLTSGEDVISHAERLMGRLKPLARDDKERAQIERLAQEIEQLKAARKDGKVLEPQDVDPFSLAIEALNQKHAVVMLSGRACILTEELNPLTGRVETSFWDQTSFRHWYASYRLPTPDGKTVEASTLWLRSPARREYKHVTFAPGKTLPPECLNLYRGLSVEPRKGEWGLFRDHIYNVICSQRQEIFEYVICWLAHLFQHPGGKRPGTALVLQGEQGTGKGTFVSQVGKIVSNHFLHVTQAGSITGRFNGPLKDALLAFVDEGFWAGDKTSEGVLKGLITEDSVSIEMKGKEIFSVPNYLRIIIASNNDWVVPAAIDERRFCCIIVSSERRGDHAYFKAINQQMDAGGREAMLYDLLFEVPLDNFNLRTIPKTKDLFEQQIRTGKPSHKFWHERLYDGCQIPGTDVWKPTLASDELYTAFISFAEQTNERYRPSKISFYQEIKKLCPGMVRRKIQIDHKRTNFYDYPSLMVCRQAYADKVNKEVDWNDDD